MFSEQTSHMPAVIRAYRRADRWNLVALINAVCAEGMMATPSFQPTPAWEHALAEPECPHHLLLVAEAEGEIVGWCRLFPAFSPNPRILELGIGVVAPRRRQGIGSALMRGALGWAAERGISQIVLTTRTDNEPARRLFTRYGFHPLRTQGHQLEMAWSAPSSRSGV